MPRPNKDRTIGAEDRMRANVARILDEQERTAAWLGKKCVDLGVVSHPSTVWKMLNVGRTIYVDEAMGIAQVLGVSITELAA